MERERFRQRSMVLGVIAVVLLVAACGRATQEEIDQALGITPTPTEDPAEVAVAAEEASAVADASGAASPVEEYVGTAALGRTRFQFTCQICHSASGSAPDLLEPGGPYADVDYATLYPILREGEGHPPGPYESFELTDSDIANIAAYIREQASQ